MIDDGGTPDQWSETIVAFESPYKLRELSAPQVEPADAREVAVEQKKFKLRLATNEERFGSASMLIQRMYSWRGYAATAPIGQAPNRITLLSFENEHIIGTLTLGLDSSTGLAVDELYKDRVDELRNAGRKVCEITKLAVDQSVRSKRVLAALFHLSYILGRKVHGGTDFLIEVNPRHVLFYQRMLGFERFGEEKICPRVNAPAVLLRLKLEFAEQQIAAFGGKMEGAGGEKSLYPFFFSAKDEDGIIGRLQRD